MRPFPITLLAFLWLDRAFGIPTKQSDLKHDHDLTSFISRPDIKAPLFNVAIYEPDKVSPGYWFVAPYWVIDPEAYTQRYSPCQVGPHIYDSDGTLIWAGSCDFGNVNAFDFKVVNSIGNQPHMSVIIGRGVDNKISNHGSAHILNTAYEIERNVEVQDDRGGFDIHEFNVLDNGHTALVTAYRPRYVDMSDAGFYDSGFVQIGGFEEIDIETGETLFDWRTRDHIPLSESNFIKPEATPKSPPGWDYIHVNSVDKNADGNYLLSARFSNTIYLISGEDGKVIWRLGGSKSSFRMDNFRMYRQHHARFVEQNERYIAISVLNNASDEISQDERTSDALIILLDLETMVATAISRFNRPDGGLSRLRGNVQVLSTGNIFVGWSESGYHSEFTREGECVMEARFQSNRFSTYRSYKYEFYGLPATPPDIVATVYQSQSAHMTTVLYVSWNGATDIARWNFYAQATNDSQPVFIGSAPKTGFETAFTSDGYMDWVSVEAVHINGTALRRSPAQRTLWPEDWIVSDTDWPAPDDPQDIVANTPAQGGPNAEGGEHPNGNTGMEILGGFGGLLIAFLVICTLGGVALALLWAYRRRSRPSYEWIPSEESLPPHSTEETPQERLSDQPDTRSTGR